MTDCRQLPFSLQTPELSQVIWSLSLGQTVVSTMFMAFDRILLSTAWFVAFGLVGLLWSPPSVAMSVLLLLVGLTCPAAMLFLWKHQPPRTFAHVVRRIAVSRPAPVTITENRHE
jgi:hypothetical protein